MANSKINGLTAATDGEVADPTQLIALADPTTGIAKKATILQVQLATATLYVYYTALGSEGSTLTIPALAAQTIIAVFREGTLLYPVVSAPDSVSYVWDSTNINLGLAVSGAGERYAIIYKA